MGQGAKRRKLVPECHAAIEQWKYEIAAELGIFPEPAAGAAENVSCEFSGELGEAAAGASRQSRRKYWGHVPAREAGYVGGSITARLVQMAEQALLAQQIQQADIT